jgi:phage-related minor tail protein
LWLFCLSNRASIRPWIGPGTRVDRLGGDELRSIAEQTPRLAQAIVDGLDKALIGGQSRTIATLKKLGSEGKLSAEVVFRAIQNQAATLEREFGKVPLTIGQSLNVLRNEFIDFVGRFEFCDVEHNFPR